MLLVQPAIPLSAETLVAPLPALPGAAGASAASAAGPSGVIVGADPQPGWLWPLGSVPGVGDSAGTAPWLPWAPGGEGVLPSMVSGSVGVPPTDVAASEPLGPTPDLGGIALLLGGLLVLAGWRHARR